MLALGIDLSEDKMDLTLLRDTLRGPRLKAKARFYLPQSDKGEESRRHYCGRKLRQFLDENEARSAEVVVGLPRRHFLMRNLTIPSVRAEDVNRIMRYEADRHIPFEVGEVYYDTICPERSQGPGSMEILFVAIRKGTMDGLLEPLNFAGLRPAVVDVSTLASVTAYLERSGGVSERTAFVEIGEATVIVSLLQEGHLRYSRACSLAQMLRASEELADPAAAMAEAIGRELDLLAWSNCSGGGPRRYERLVLTGAGATNSRLLEALEREMELEAMLFAPLGQSEELEAQEAVDRSRSTSLALRGLQRSDHGLNFLPEERRLVRTDHGPYIAAVLGLLILLQMGLLYADSFRSRQIRLATVRHAVQRLQPEADKVLELKNRVDRLQARVDEMLGLVRLPPPRIVLLSELTSRLPEQAWVDYLHIRDETLKLKVRSDPGLPIAADIDASPYLRETKIQSQQGDALTIEASIVNPDDLGEDGGGMGEEGF